MVSKDLNHQFIARLLELVNHSVVQRVLVLLKPASEVVRHGACIMTNGEVGSHLTRFGWLWFLEVGRLAQMIVHQLLLKGLISSLGEHRLFLKDGQDTHRLLN